MSDELCIYLYMSRIVVDNGTKQVDSGFHELSCHEFKAWKNCDHSSMIIRC